MKQTIFHKRVESKAKVRRRIIKAWTVVGRGMRYKRAAVRESYKGTVQDIENEMFDGIILSLSPRNSDKGINVQMRLLRRIVEKRQSQAVRRHFGHSEDLSANHTATANSKRCMRELRKFQNCL